MTYRFVLSGLALALAIGLALAQNPAGQPQSSSLDTVIRINVNLVQVDAVVTDSKGHPVTDLKAEDFEIRQDGKLQKISNCSFISTRPGGPDAPRTAAKPTAKPKANDPSAPPPVPVRTAQVRRTFALIVDDLGLSFEGIAYTHRALEKFVDQGMQPGDLVAIIRTSAGMGSLQQFTTDKRILHKAIDRLRFSSLSRVGVSGFAAVGPEGGGAGMAERASMMTSGSLGAINYVVAGLRDVPGRKAIVLFTEDLRISGLNGADPRAQFQFERLVDAANRSSVVISSVDPRGLQYYGPTAADGPMSGMQAANISSMRSTHVFFSQDGMSRLADATGGLFIHDNNDISGALQQVVDDGDGYYLVGYHPDPLTFNRRPGQQTPFHNIKVSVKRPGLKVRSRKGFFGNPDAPRRVLAQTPQAQLIRAAVSPFASGDIRVRMTGLFAQSAEIGPFVTALLYIEPHDIRFDDMPDNLHRAVLDLVVMTFNESGQVEDPREQIHTLTLPDADYRRVMEQGLVYQLRHPVKKAGGYQMRIAVRDNGTLRMGSASQYVEVPDLGNHHLALTSIVLQKTSAPAEAAGSEGGEGHVGGNRAFATAATRVFQRGDSLIYGCKILNGRMDSAGHPQMEMEVRLFRDGKQVLASPPRTLTVEGQVDANHLGASGQLNLGSEINPGDFVIQIIVTDKLADAKYRIASQWMDFEVK